jgi:hypothetical protein
MKETLEAKKEKNLRKNPKTKIKNIWNKQLKMAEIN